MKRALLLAGTLAAVLAIAGGAILGSTFRMVPRLFHRNAELKAQGYDMGEFEFKMLAAEYQLDHGHWLEARRTLRRIDREMTAPVRLPRLPKDASPAERLAFMTGRQDPGTGAFMDPAYPFFTYFAPTLNAVAHIREEAERAGVPLRLAHPLRFLERIREPRDLEAYLDSLLYMHPWCARFPGPGPYGPGVSELAYYDEFEAAGVHHFSPAWQDTLRRWFYETQDPATGFWGARLGNARHWTQKQDLNATYHILHLVLDSQGADRSPAYPLRHADALAEGVLARLAPPLPADAAGQHDWGLGQTQGAGMLTRLLWPRLAPGRQEAARAALRRLLVESFRLYRPESGGFAYYSSDQGADLDGTGLALGLLRA
ncbi:MAG TPA: hypothetical protein VN436_17605, partial [Holophaga sp.]|nr:hypothetical protein [Holophaga sp.]